MATLKSTTASLRFTILGLINYQTCMVLSTNYGQTYIWPLNNRTYGSEVNQNTAQDNYQPGFKFREVHPHFNSLKALTFDGSEYVDIAVGSASFSDYDFTLAIHFKQSSSTNSTLFYYQTTSSTGTMITEFKASVIGGKLVLSKTAYGSVEKKAFPNSVVVNTWYTLLFCVTRSNGRYESYLDDSSLIYEDNYLSDQSLTTPGSIRLGADVDGGSKFTGAVICMGLFTENLDHGDIDGIRSLCDSSNWIHHPSASGSSERVHNNVSSEFKSELCLPATTTTTPTTTTSTTTTTPSTTTATTTTTPTTTTSTTTTTPSTTTATTTTTPTTTTSTTTTTPSTTTATTTTTPTTTTSTTTTTPSTATTTTTPSTATTTTTPTTTTSTTTTTPSTTTATTTTTPTTTTSSTSTTTPSPTTSTTTTTTPSTTTATTTTIPTTTTSTTTTPTAANLTTPSTTTTTPTRMILTTAPTITTANAQSLNSSTASASSATTSSSNTDSAQLGICRNFDIGRVAIGKKPNDMTESPFVLSDVGNLLSCAWRCGRNLTCVSFSFDVSSKTCAFYALLHNVIDLVASPNETYYIIKL